MKNLNRIYVVLDRSGSMQTIKDETIAGFNAFLSEQIERNPKSLLSMIQFDHIIEKLHTALPIGAVPPLTTDTYIPRGTTALLDAIGFTLVNASEKHQMLKQKHTSIAVIITDGQENSSYEFNQCQIFKMIRHFEEQFNWQFVFLGANQDAIREASKYGISAKRSMSYAHDKRGVEDMFSALSQNIVACCLNESEFEFTSAQRDSQNR
jgi:uncharacterized protein YegL